MKIYPGLVNLFWKRKLAFMGFGEQNIPEKAQPIQQLFLLITKIFKLDFYAPSSSITGSQRQKYGTTFQPEIEALTASLKSHLK
jgi:hypothetical protein